MESTRFKMAAGMIVAAAAARLMPHPLNFTPIGGMALFGGAVLDSRPAAFLVPLTAMLLSDAVIGFHSLMPAVYACFAATVCLGICIRKNRRPSAVAAATLASSCLFFLLTNFFMWAFGGASVYPLTGQGLLACYFAGIPYFWNTLAGDALYSLLLFGGFALAERLVPQIPRRAIARRDGLGQ